MKVKIILILAIIGAFIWTNHSLQTRQEKINEIRQQEEREQALAPLKSEMINIAKLSTIECTYHNVSEFIDEDAYNFLWISKDKRFWIEYDATVTVGVDVSNMDIEIKGKKVTVTLPTAQIQCKLNRDSVTKESFFVDVDSAKISSDDEIRAIADAQIKLNEEVSNNSVILNEANRQTKTLLTEYVNNISEVTGIDYEIVFKEK